MQPILVEHGIYVLLPKDWQRVTKWYYDMREELDRHTREEMRQLIDLAMQEPTERQVPYRVERQYCYPGQYQAMDFLQLPEGNVQELLPYAFAYVTSLDSELSMQTGVRILKSSV